VDRLAGQSQNHLRNERSSLTAIALAQPFQRIYTHETDASVWHYWPSDADTHSKLADFSPAGCALFSTNAIGVGKIVMIETDLFNAICRVRHSRKESASGYSIGLEFITLDMLATRGALLDSTA